MNIVGCFGLPFLGSDKVQAISDKFGAWGLWRLVTYLGSSSLLQEIITKGVILATYRCILLHSL